jgi:hypothetical protein
MPSEQRVSAFNYSTFDWPHDILYVDGGEVEWQLASFRTYYLDSGYWDNQRGFREFSNCWVAVEAELVAIADKTATEPFGVTYPSDLHRMTEGGRYLGSAKPLGRESVQRATLPRKGPWGGC